MLEPFLFSTPFSRIAAANRLQVGQTPKRIRCVKHAGKFSRKLTVIVALLPLKLTSMPQVPFPCNLDVTNGEVAKHQDQVM